MELFEYASFYGDFSEVWKLLADETINENVENTTIGETFNEKTA